MRRFLWLPVFSILFIWAAHAHRLNLSYSVEEGNLVLYAYTGDDIPVVEGDVSIFNAQGDELVSGHTDMQGHFVWTITDQQDITVKIYAGLGHKITKDIPASEIQVMLQEAGGSSRDSQGQTANLQVNSEPFLSPEEQTHVEPAKRSAVRSTENQWGTTERIILGFTFLLAGAAAWSSYRSTKKLTEIEALLRSREPRN